MKKYIILCSFLFVVNSAMAEQIRYDTPYPIANQRRGSVYINGERYDVTETIQPWGNTKMEVKNYNNSYRGDINSSGYGILRDYQGNSIKVSPY